MQLAREILPWREFALPRAPWSDADSMNPSIVRVPDDSGDAHAGKWLCNVRAASFPAKCPQAHHWPRHPRFQSHHEGDLRLSGERSHCSHTRNWIVQLDAEAQWATIGEGAEIKRAPSSSFPSEFGSYNYAGYEDLRLAWTRNDGLVASGTTLMFSDRGAIEIAVLDLDEHYQIAHASPVRGWWSRECQKNWSPFLGLPNLRWLYSPEVGGVIDRYGEIPKQRAFSPKLCGGTQLVRVGFDRWLGLGHGYDPVVVNGRETGGRYYWHRAFIVDAAGTRYTTGQRFKLSEHDVDFACGLAVDPRAPDRAVVTYGVGNCEPRLAETSLAALMDLSL